MRFKERKIALCFLIYEAAESTRGYQQRCLIGMKCPRLVHNFLARQRSISPGVMNELFSPHISSRRNLYGFEKNSGIRRPGYGGDRSVVVFFAHFKPTCCIGGVRAWCSAASPACTAERQQPQPRRPAHAATAAQAAALTSRFSGAPRAASAGHVACGSQHEAPAYA